MYLIRAVNTKVRAMLGKRDARPTFQTLARLFRLMLFMSLSVDCQGSSPIHVTFINPSDESSFFWNRTTEFMQAAAKDLGITLHVVHGNADRIQTTRSALSTIETRESGEYLVYIFHFGQEARILDYAERAGIYSVTINTDVSPNNTVAVGQPGEYYNYWLAHLSPNDAQAGADLANFLVHKAQRENQKDQIDMIALSGTLDSSSATERNAGLEQFIRTSSVVKLNQMTWAKWQTDLARLQTNRLLKRYPSTCAIWAASDNMALGAYQALQSNANSQCKAIQIGSIDWSEWGIQAVKQEILSASIGGHFMEGAWALVLIYDHYHRHNARQRPKRIRTPMQLIHSGNLHLYESVLVPSNWSAINFRHFTQNPDGNPQFIYQFNVDAVRKQIAENQAKLVQTSTQDAP